VSVPCWACDGTGRKDRVLFPGHRPCTWCGGSGQQADLEDVAHDARMSYQAAAENVMDRIDPDYDWAGDFEDGYEVPGGAAEDWARNPGAGWDDP
jgi:hypothetical protein